MSQFIYYKIWLFIGGALIATVIFLTLTTKPIHLPQIEYGDKVSHLIAYAALSGWFCQLYLQVSLQAWIFLFFCAMGIVLEILQGMGGVRMFEYADMVANAIGALLGLILSRTWFKGALEKVDRFLAVKFNS